MFRSRLVLIGLAVLGVLAALWYWPSWGLAGWVAKASHGRVQVLWGQGTLAQGQAQLGLSDGRVLRTLPGLWQWRLCVWACPKPFAWGQAGLLLAHPTLGAGLALYVNPQGVQLSSGQVQWPAAWLAALGAPFNTLGPTGTLQLQWQETLHGFWKPQAAQASQASQAPMALALQWQQAGLALSPVRPLGQWQLNALGTPQEGFTLTLSSQQGPLYLTGQGQWSWQHGFNFAAYATPQPQSRAALQGLLQQVAKAEGERYRIRLF